MTTRRPIKNATSSVGVNAVRTVVQGANSIFHEIDLSNDIGNDAFIEFIVDEHATGWCIAAQIKCGASYVATDGSLLLIADRDHFEYWRSHVLPIAGLVVDPATNRIGWCDVTAHLRENPLVVDEGPFRIQIPSSQLLTPATFADFRDHFVAYHRQFSDDAHFGAALERLVALDAQDQVAALRSLFSYHRNRGATWCYVASILRSVEDPYVLSNLVSALSHLPGHGDIFWHDMNQIEPTARRIGVDFLQRNLSREDVVRLLSVVDDAGFARGTIGQAVHSVIALMRDRAEVLRSIALDQGVEEATRYCAIFLFVFYAQAKSVTDCIEVLQEFRRSLPDGFQDEVIVAMIQGLREHGPLSFY